MHQNWLHLFFPLDDGIYCQRFGAAGRDERRRLVARGGGASALDGFNGQRIMPIYVCTVIKKNERMERAKAWCRGRYRVISGIKKSNKNPGRVKMQL